MRGFGAFYLAHGLRFGPNISLHDIDDLAVPLEKQKLKG
jgi:hypothetical protein